MERFLVYIITKIFKFFLIMTYAVMKIFVRRVDKVVFCSRQSRDVPIDFLLIEKELKRRNPELKTVKICRTIGENLKEYLAFFCVLIISMYHLAGSRVCVLDSYWPTVSMLNHGNDLSVIQIWHAIGKIKSSGYQSLGKVSGRKKEYAKIFNMHEKYDYIIAGAKAWNIYYCESFNVTEDKLLNYGLPRIDYLMETYEANRERFFNENPHLRKKEIILYAPTFRRNMRSVWADIVDAIDHSKYALIIKNHSGQKIEGEKPGGSVYYFDEWESIDLLSVCDYLITDYSAISLEAAIINKKTYYWVYDYDEYIENNGLNINLWETASGNVFRDIGALIRALEEKRYNTEALQKYIDRYLPENLGTSTEKICDLICTCFDRKV